MILILGLGAYPQGSGTAAALHFAKLASKTGEKVVVTDMKPVEALHAPTIAKLKRYKHVELVFGKHRKQDIKAARLIVRNPAIPDTSPFIEYAKQLGKPITNDVGVFLDALRERYNENEVPVVAITGTRGKSTTTSLTAHMLRTAFGDNRIHLGGNIGVSPLFFLHKLKPGHIVVLEMSSWLLHDLHKPSFRVAVVTNLLRDHMNYYSSMMTYRRDKERIFTGQTADDVAIVNADAPITQLMAKRSKGYKLQFGPLKLKGSQLLGKHNEYNIGAAAAAVSVFGVTPKEIDKAVRSFKPVSNRLELIRTYKGRTFYNDTTATTPDATIAALEAFGKKVILIAGGNSKNLPLKDMVKAMKKHVKQAVLLEGNATHDLRIKNQPAIEVDEMDEAVKAAWAVSKPGDIILLSPGLSWLPKMNEFERGRQFVKAVKKLR